MHIYDSTESEAWKTLTHEACEYELQSVNPPYRLLVNALIETLEKSVYAQKEQFIDSLPRIFEVIEKNTK